MEQEYLRSGNVNSWEVNVFQERKDKTEDDNERAVVGQKHTEQEQNQRFEQNLHLNRENESTSVMYYIK